MIWTWPWSTVTLDTLGKLARRLANKTAPSVKPRPIPPTREQRYEMDAHMKKVGADDEYRQHSGPRLTVPMWLYGGDCCNDPSSSKTSPSTCKISCGAKLGYTQRDSCDVLGWC